MAISLKVKAQPQHAGRARYAAALRAADDLFLAGASSAAGGAVRRLHGAGRRQGDALLRHPDRHARQCRDHHHRGAWHDREAAPAAKGLHRRASRAMRLLHQRHDHEGQGTLIRNRAIRCRCGMRWPVISVGAERTTGLSPPSCGPAKRSGGWAMNAPTLTRRGFTKANGRPGAAFSLDPAELLAQGSARCPAASTTIVRCKPDPIGGDGNATVIPARWSWAGHSDRALADRRRGARSRASRADLSADTALSPDEGRPPAASRSRTARRYAGLRRGARDAGRSRRGEARVPAIR